MAGKSAISVVFGNLNENKRNEKTQVDNIRDEMKQNLTTNCQIKTDRAIRLEIGITSSLFLHTANALLVLFN